MLETYVCAFNLFPEPYNLLFQKKKERVLIWSWCRYKDHDSIKVHASSDYFKELGKAVVEEDLLAEPMKKFVTKDVGGYHTKL